jgi:hypothetical protein
VQVVNSAIMGPRVVQVVNSAIMGPRVVQVVNSAITGPRVVQAVNSAILIRHERYLGLVLRIVFSAIAIN